ncbi:MAG: toll/interleukin-1 receptor domain-containing protein [Anaerolineae bacterium]|nr:toll/interleukin-1 receptor domain-containing protein [Anaerolineae bacterium]
MSNHIELKEFSTLLEPLVDTAQERRAFVYTALHSVPSLLRRIDYEGSTFTFVANLYRECIAFGNINDNMSAIEAVLIEVRQLVGEDKQQRIDALIEQFRQSTTANVLQKKYDKQSNQLDLMEKKFFHIQIDTETSTVHNRWNNQGVSISLSLPSFPTTDFQLYGQTLFNTVIDRSLYDEARSQVSVDGRVLTIVIYEPADAPQTMWETLHDGDDFLNDQGIAILRAASSTVTEESPAIRAPIRILVVNISDDEVDEKMLRRMAQESAGGIVVDVLYKPSRIKLFQHIRDSQSADTPYHIWHIVSDLTSSGDIALDGQLLTLDQWQSLVRDYSILKLVTLNLSSGTQYINQLRRSSAPFVVCPTAEVNPEIRGAFFRTFYVNLVESGVVTAFQKAQLYLRSITFESAEWSHFAVLIRSFDDMLIAQRKTSSLVETQLMRDQVFISYSHRDQEWCDTLMDYLSPLRKHHVVKAWVDRDIKVGSEWFDEIYKALHQTKVAVILASKSFFDSSFIQEHELPYILDCHKRGECTVVWVAVGAYPYEYTPLNAIQGVHPPNQPLDRMPQSEAEDVMIKIVRTVEAALK